MTFTSEQTYAFVMSPRLGDSLLAMVVANNLVRKDFRVTVFSTQLIALRTWFPHIDIRPLPAGDAVIPCLNAFDIVLHAFHADLLVSPEALRARTVVFDDLPVYRQVKNMVDIHMELCEQHFGLTQPVRENGMTPPAHTRSTVEARRVIIHPVASDQQKSWRPQRFVKLAKALKAQGFEPEFLLPRNALPQWQWLETQGFRPTSPGGLEAVATRIAESGWVIGNDSGIGHLASNLGIPTVSLARRRRIAQRWRPGWAPSRAVVALPLLPSRFLKEKFWKFLLSTGRVMRAFHALRRECGAPGIVTRTSTALNTETVADIRHAGG